MKRIFYFALAISLVLMIPLIGNWPWTGSDFVFAGILLSGSALAYELISRSSPDKSYRIAVGIAVAATLLLVWVSLAVGIIGSENNIANVMYFVVLLIGFIGAMIARLRARGMAIALFTTAIGEALVPFIALIVWRPEITTEEPGAIGVFILSFFFSALFAISGMLFLNASDSTNPVAAK